ncbi:MAG: MaoC family dehydratase [Actinobacteria bacterium]|nr:MaoC family dehydratase [Actinomycetota bacterium]
MIRPTNPQPWSIVAQNLPEHARNRIHTDDGAREAGFPRALVAGVTTYAYLTHPIAEAWGLGWVSSGGGEVRFRRPVFDGDLVRCVVEPIDGGVAVAAVTDEPEQPRAVFRAVARAEAQAAMRPGELLPVKRIPLDAEWGSDYGARAGDPFDLYVRNGIVHPAVWPALANHVVHTEVARGSWIHTRSIVRHHALAPAGDTAEVRSTVVRRFESHGERAVLDVHIVVNDQVVASLEHEAIVALP